MNYKISFTKKPYRVNLEGFKFVVPKGCKVSNKTAMGADDNYHFLAIRNVCPEPALISLEEWWSGNDMPLTLIHELTYKGVNIPAEYCNEY
jgi:hypothetical protein